MKARKSIIILSSFLAVCVFLSFSSLAWAVDPEGCLVCHGDEQFAKAKPSIYIDEEAYLKSVHKDIPCSNCHLGFDIMLPHKPVAGAAGKIAAIACKDCHAKPYASYKTSVHGKAFLAGDTDSAACGDCHGSHAIQSLKDEEVRKEFRLKGKEVCGICHEKAWDSYNDYYHGQAYKSGSKEAPTCWECHGYHKILDKAAVMTAANKNETCGRKGCHPGVGQAFLDQYGPIVHGLKKAFEENFILKWLRGLFSWFPW